MIAPHRTASMADHPAARSARQTAAWLLLPPPEASTAAAPKPLPAWQGWLFSGWLLLVAGSYLARMAAALLGG